MALTPLPTPTPSRSQSRTVFVDATNNFLAALPTMVEEIDAALISFGSAGGAITGAYTFSTTTTDSDPGAGVLRLNNATQNAATVIRADLLLADGSDWTAVLDSLDDSSSVVKGQLRLSVLGDSTKWLLFNVTSIASPSGYRNITAAVVSSSAANPFANGDTLLLMFARTGDAGATGPSGSTSVIRSARTSNTVLGLSDIGYLIDITSGTFSQTFSPAVTLGSGWWCYLRNSGTGEVTLDPNGSELIDGLTTYKAYPGECRLIQCTGTEFYSVVLTPFAYSITSTLTFTRPPGYSLFGGLLWGGGGGGGNGITNFYAGGGGGGACHPFTFTAAQLGASQTITIGAGGTAAGSNTSGGVGGTSSIGSLALAYGGGGGGGDGATDAYGGGGGGILSAGSNGSTSPSAAGGRPQIIDSSNAACASGVFGGSKGQGSSDALYARDSTYGGAGGGSSATAGTAGSSIYGGAGGGGITGANGPVAAGTSVYGGNGGAASVAGSATAGSVPGGGGGATHTGTAAAGGAGKCLIWGIV